MIGVFGADMAEMQVHLTLMLVVSIILITAQVRPFDGSKRFLLHALEMASLMATFLTLWAGSIFNTLPKCEDPLKGEGFTLPWCDALSIIVGLIDIGMFITFIVCFLYLKATTKNGENSSNGNGATGVERNCCVQKVADCIYALERQRVLRMTPEEQQLRARSRTVDARNSVTAINPVINIEMVAVEMSSSNDGEVQAEEETFDASHCNPMTVNTSASASKENVKRCRL